MSADVSLERLLFAIPHDSRANFTATLQNSHDGGFVFGASLSNPALVFVSVHESGRATDEGFINLNFAIWPTEFQERTVLHCQTDAVKHEPCGFLSYTKGAVDLVGTDAILAANNQPCSREPLLQLNRGILKDSTRLESKRLPLARFMFGVALPYARLGKPANLLSTAARAPYNAVRPTQLDHKFAAMVEVRKPDNRVPKSGWGYVFHEPSMRQISRYVKYIIALVFIGRGGAI